MDWRDAIFESRFRRNVRRRQTSWHDADARSWTIDRVCYWSATRRAVVSASKSRELGRARVVGTVSCYFVWGTRSITCNIQSKPLSHFFVTSLSLFFHFSFTFLSLFSRYGLFYGGYKTSRFFWETIITTRKVGVVMLSVFGPELGPEKQAQVALLILLICIVSEIYGDPYAVKTKRHKVLGRLEFAALAIEWWTMWSGLMIFQLEEDDPMGAVLTVSAVIGNTVLFLWFVVQFVKEKLHERHLEKIKAANHNDGSSSSGGIVQTLTKRMSDMTARFTRKSSRKKVTMGNPMYNPETKKETKEETKEMAAELAKKAARLAGGRGKKTNGKKSTTTSKKTKTKKKTKKSNTKQAGTGTESRTASSEIQLTEMKAEKHDKEVSKGNMKSGSSGEEQHLRPELYHAEKHDKEVSKGNITINTDPTSGHRFSYNNTTGESIWLDAEEMQAGDSGADGAGGKGGESSNVRVDDGGVTISRDPTSGHRYSFNNATGESIWLDEEEIPADDGEGGEVSGNGITISRDPTSGHRYSFNNTTGESIWLDEAIDAEATTSDPPETKWEDPGSSRNFQTLSHSNGDRSSSLVAAVAAAAIREKNET